jgi:hypothetical protein
MNAIKLECIMLVVLLFSPIFIANLHVASASNQKNVNSSISIEGLPNNTYPMKFNPDKARVAEYKITVIELEELKSKVGAYEEGRNYNELINGHGTGLRPPTEEEWSSIAESSYFVDNVAYDSSPPSVDQSAKPWFPPIGNQDGEGSCVAWAVEYYTKTFQEAKEQSWDLSGATWEGGYNGYPTQSYQNRIISPDFIYHLINGAVAFMLRKRR